MSAGDPLTLLALVTIWEVYGEEWNQQLPPVMDEIYDKADWPLEDN